MSKAFKEFLLGEAKSITGSSIESFQRKDSMHKLEKILTDEKSYLRNYDKVALGASEDLWGTQMADGTRFDSATSLAVYELMLDIDRRVIEPIYETSYLRKNFDNFPGEKVFEEYTGVNMNQKVYVPTLVALTGLNTTDTNPSPIKETPDPTVYNEIKLGATTIKRDIVVYPEGFSLSLLEIGQAATIGIDSTSILSAQVGRDLALKEQEFAFLYGPYTDQAAIQNGLLFNTFISTSLVWAAGAILDPATSGRAILSQFINTRGDILKTTRGAFANQNMKLCAIMSLNNYNALSKSFSDLVPGSVLDQLTKENFRLAGLPILDDETIFFYYQDRMNLELSTAQRLLAQPQSYNKAKWFFPYINVTAGLTVKRKESIYRLAIPSYTPS